MKIIFEDLLPGETPIDDVSQLKIPGISTRRELTIVEAENIRKVLVHYFTDRPRGIASFDLDWARNLHREMYEDVWGWAGQFRARDLNLGCHWTQIQEQLYNLLENLRFWETNGVDLIEQATWLHHRAVQIHPFVNGNGRWARILANIWLVDHGYSHVHWPEQTIGDHSFIRNEYIEALKAADLGHYDPLVDLHRRFASTPPRPVVAQQCMDPSMLEPGRVIESGGLPPLPAADS